jgi:hypothetical protein
LFCHALGKKNLVFYLNEALPSFVCFEDLEQARKKGIQTREESKILIINIIFIR